MLHLPWMSHSDRKRWKTARTLTDLGQLTAAWWEGTVRRLPDQRANYRPHPTLTAHTAVLATANRAGFLIPAAQAGLTDHAVQQRAAVQGFVSEPALVRRLVDAAEKAGLEIVLNDWLDFEYDGPGTGITVTTGDGRDVVFGQALGLADLKAMWPSLPYAVGAVAPALQITLADPQFGPSILLWDTLAAAPRPAAPSPAPKVVCRECGCTAIDWQVCGDGCSGVLDQADGRCAACIDPSVIIDWSKEPEEKECALCGAPFYHAGDYCSEACDRADWSDADDPPVHRSTESDDSPNECTLCRAPFSGTGDYCTVLCKLADTPWSDGEGEPPLRASERIQAKRRQAAAPDDPWATSPF
ncbi:DUF6919 domain-containing protein [Streptomyces sp. TRM68367]|uniref:DUF6919 domain-containing protein n=1 Tax=Streptomyces sp. TRM68367 TaxID=2758415 RepID=UPI00165A6C91|nr:hypothetical protein [Streptomyces sp. TRM68367]MBC9730978.1 hypothetical protein [Streptomyces sp. TRM68367]